MLDLATVILVLKVVTTPTDIEKIKMTNRFRAELARLFQGVCIDWMATVQPVWIRSRLDPQLYQFSATAVSVGAVDFAKRNVTAAFE